jgi:hypothetical protein
MVTSKDGSSRAGWEEFASHFGFVVGAAMAADMESALLHVVG